MTDARGDYWRRLDELLENPELHEALVREFPPAADVAPGEFSRRSFVRLLGAGLALAGVNGCVRRPRERILPYVHRPPEITPTIAQHYATSMTVGGYATGLLVESHTGRPTKVEGNPDHPASLGAAGVLEQASVLGLYDPNRARTVRLGGRPSSWDAFAAALAGVAAPDEAGARGRGLHLLVEPTASPFELALLDRVRERFPDVRIHRDAPLAISGAAPHAVYDFTAADVVLAFDADFLTGMPFSLRYAHDFATRRRVASPADGMNRLYAIEPAPTVTGRTADHRLRAGPREVAGLLAALAARFGVAGDSGQGAAGGESVGEHARWLDAVAADLVQHRGRAAIVVGERQPPAVHALAQRMNVALGAVGSTVRYIEPPIPPADAGTGLAALADALQDGEVGWLLVLDANPVYTAPPDLGLPALLARARQSAYLGLYRNETARACRWFAPAQHYLESWGDGRAWDGTVSLVQPLIEPLFGGHSTADVLLALSGNRSSAHEALRDSYRPRLGANFERSWDELLQRGVLPETAAPASEAALAASAQPPAPSVPAPAATPAPSHPERSEGSRPPGTLDLLLAPSAALHDGRFANNAWLQELPDPITTLTWGNAALLSPATATRLGVVQGQSIEIAAGSQTIALPVVVVPGHADDAVSVSLGYGRPKNLSGEGAEEIAAGVGANAWRFRPADGGFVVPGVRVRALGARVELPVTQRHWEMDGRDIALSATLAEYRERETIAPKERGKPLALYEPDSRPQSPDQWAMTIDLSTCTGCSACVVACQAENNVPVVGAEGVRDGREMHWLRLDHYFAGTADEPVTLSQPMLCQHCERAPCEYVCPVAATVHSPDGLNEMVYNRCVGTRFCSNNCPYKVRRFNWFDYNAEVSETERLAKNPDVTVRARGVMEKCTFCVQRIREKQIVARGEGRGVKAGEVRTACQQACPSQAIVFGSLTNADDEVTRWRDHPRAYSVLHELGTEPRVRYLARITNPNPALAD